jgi:hypothetical protein
LRDEWREKQRAAEQAEDRARSAQRQAEAAQAKVEAAKQKADQAREEWYNADPRRAARLAQADRERLDDEIRRTTEALQKVRDEGDMNKIPQAAQEAQKRLDRLHEERAAAGSREREAFERVRERMAVEEGAKQWIDESIRKRFGIPELPEDRQGPMRIANDTTEVREQSMREQARRGIHGGPGGQEPPQAEPGLQGTHTAGNKADPRSVPPGADEKNWKERPVSVGARQDDTLIHERIHAHTHPGFLVSHGRHGKLVEGLTEHFTQKVLDQNALEGRPSLGRTPAYLEPVDVVKHLENKVGEDALLGAKFHGDVDGLRRAIGEKLGEPDPAKATAAGRKYLNTIADLMEGGDYEAARQMVDWL